MSKKNQATGRPIFEFHSPHGYTRDVEFVVTTYKYGQPQVRLLDSDTGELWTVVTTTYDKTGLGLHETCIKNWGNNEGMAKFIAENQLGFIDGNFNDEYLLWYIPRDVMEYIDPNNEHVLYIKKTDSETKNG